MRRGQETSMKVKNMWTARLEHAGMGETIYRIYRLEIPFGWSDDYTKAHLLVAALNRDEDR